MARVRQQVRVDGSGAAVAVVGVVAVVGLVSVLALAVVGLVVVGTVAVVGLTAAGGVRYARYRAEAAAALELWRDRARREVEAARADGSATAHHDALVRLHAPPPPRVALAMLRLEQQHTPALGRTVETIWRAQRRAADDLRDRWGD